MGSSSRSTSKPGKRESSSLRHRKIRASKTRNRAHPKRRYRARKARKREEKQGKSLKRTVRQAMNRAKSSSELLSTPENTERLSEKEIMLSNDLEKQDENEIVDRRKSVAKVQEKTAIHYREIGPSEREIATIMGMNPSTVHSIVKGVSTFPSTTLQSTRWRILPRANCSEVFLPLRRGVTTPFSGRFTMRQESFLIVSMLTSPPTMP